MTYYITFQMIGHTYTATHHTESKWGNLENWIKENQQRIKNVVEVKNGTEKKNKEYLEAVKITIEHYKNQ